MKKYLFKLFLLFFSLVLSIQAATIRGIVIDAKTGQPLPGANILLKGTYYGAASDVDGTYIIPNLSPGSYDLEVSMIGYTVQLHGGLVVKKEETKVLDLKLESTVLALGQEVMVIGERPIIDADNTSSSATFRASDIENKVVESVSDIISQQAGVSKSGDNEIHIRGGRVDEGQFIVDGLSIKDPLTGATNSLYVNPNAIKELEFITGGFNAEYGQAMSGIIDVKLKEGSRSFEGSVRYKTDKINPDNFNTDNIEFTLGGPLFSEDLRILPGNMSFFVSGYLYKTDTYLPGAGSLYPYRKWTESFVSRQVNNFSSMAKLNWQITPKNKFSISYNHSANVSRDYSYTYKEILDNYPTTTRESQVVNAMWSHTLNSKLFYNMNLGYFYTGKHEAVQNKHWTEYEEMLDLDPTTYTPLDLFGTLRVYSGDEFWDHGDAPNWYDYYSKNISFESSITWQPNTRHTVKSGFSHRNTFMQVIDIYKPWAGANGFGETYDYYDVQPSDGSFYVQDKITFEGMIANIGLRYDYWIIGEYVEDVVNNPDVFTISPEGKALFLRETYNLLGRRAKGHLSPRIGISHPVTDSDVLYFNYGHFSQLPTYNYVYANLTSRSENPYSLIGNPNLSPKTTVAYEIGIKHKFSSSTAIEFKAYYKDMFDYETSQRITSFNPLVGNYSMLIYINADYARSRGIEIIFRRLYGRYFSGDASFSYSISTGKASRPDDNLLIEAGMLSQKPLSENYLSWDQPFRLTGNLRFNMSEETPPRLFGIRMPNHWKLNIHFDAQSGSRYTQSVATDTVMMDDGTWVFMGTSMSDNPYGVIADPYITIDMKFTKDFRFKSLRYGFYIDAENVFNHRIPRRINPFTGKAYDPGEIIPYTYYAGRNPNYDPARYYAPRQVTLGLFLNF